MQNLAYLIIKASRILKNSLERKLIEYNVTAAQFSVLNQILEKNGAITSAGIADILESDRPTVSGIINRLEQKGLIEKVRNPEDKRSSYLKLSKESIKLTAELRIVSDQLNKQIFSGFNKNEIKDFEMCLLRVIEIKDEG